ncbi:Cell wall-active antibiotics response 4TMS YvqF [Actinomadura mexicana]|uniref:Cell wall-active antibiotics response 4TMS YvqF n=2 Tax=Actinomadura mexicana TaxID=134959 RepID=A0A238Y392_9ACTN|nr:Cell wall-active antibiotics response 4TMS YvqF [Actinomadura mexicana]
MRASDADRDEVADRLREALAEGRITPEEHAERIDAVYNAKTYAELEPVLSDLPSQHMPRPRVDLRKEQAPAPPSPQSPHLVAVFSGAERKGRWLVEPTTTVTCVFGGAEVDFRQAVLSRNEVTLAVTCVFGGVNIVVPPGVRVVGSNFAIFGGTDLPEDDTTDPDAPVIRLTGVLLFGGVSVERRAVGEKRGRARHRERHQLHRGHQELHGGHQEHRERRDARRDRLRELRDERHHGR